MTMGQCLAELPALARYLDAQRSEKTMPSMFLPSIHGHEAPRPADFDWDEHEKRLLAHQRRVWRHLAREALVRDGVRLMRREWSELLGVPLEDVEKRLRSPEPV